jgi:hypothetical protein
MTETTTFSNKSNAKRAAEKAIRDGKAPSIKYGFRTLNNGRLARISHTG